MKQYNIIVHDIIEDGFPPQDYEVAGLIGRIAFIFDGTIYCGWPLRNDDGSLPAMEEVEWEDGETAHHFSGVKKWIELPVPGWEL